MITLYSITGGLIVLFFLLASVNGLKKYIESPLVAAIASKHRIFGMLASFTAFIHMGYALSQGQLRPTGAISLLALLSTGTFGMLFAVFLNNQSKYFQYLSEHRNVSMGIPRVVGRCLRLSPVAR